jgi:hypothetical protein
MAVNSEPRSRTFKAEGTIRPFRFVKWGTDDNQILECDANEKSVGIYQHTETLSVGDFGEIALQGGGGLLEVSETVAKGKFLTPTADGLGEVVDLAGEFYGAIAQESGVVGDIIGVEVIPTTESVSSDA